jgi:hypothetical protein
MTTLGLTARVEGSEATHTQGIRMMKCSTSLLTVVVAAAALAGCATPPEPVKEVDEVRIQLEKSIQKVQALPEFTDSADRKPPEAKAEGPTISVVYHGEATNLLRRIAASRGVGFKVVGPHPRRDIFVSVDMREASFEEFLTDVGHQFGQIATLVLNDAGIEVRYRDHR